MGRSRLIPSHVGRSMKNDPRTGGSVMDEIAGVVGPPPYPSPGSPMPPTGWPTSTG